MMAGPWDNFQTGSPGAPWQVFESGIDKKSGAPAEVRALVGGAPLQDRLANLQRYYPDAQPFDDDNFVFTDPESGRPTLYNPRGLDTGDVASVAREGVMTVGATLGAAAGGLAGGAAGLPTGPGALVTAGTGAALGAGLGNATAATVYDAAMNWLNGRIDTRTGPDIAVSTVLDVAAGAVGQRAGDVIGAGLKTWAAGAQSEVKRLVAAFERLKITPPAAAVSDSKPTQLVAKGLENSLFSADVMEKQAAAVLAQTKTAVDDVVAKFGQAQTQQGAGATIKSAAVGAAERFGFRQEQLYDDAFNMIGADTIVPLQAVTALRGAMNAELGRAPSSTQQALSPALRMLQSLESDAARTASLQTQVTGGGLRVGGIPFESLRQVRTAIGRDLATPMLSGSSGAQNEALKRIYGALTEDMSAAARAAGPSAAKALATADRYTRTFMTQSAKTMDKIARFEADERAFSFAMTSARDGGSALARLRRNFLPEEWDTVAATVLGRLGKAPPGAQGAGGDAFSVSTFMTNWSRLAPEAKQALFGGKRYEDLAPALDDLVTVISSLKDVEKLGNASGTARTMFTMAAMGSLSSVVGGVATGTASGAGAGLIAQALVTRSAAKLITSPKFVRWLAAAPEESAGIPAHIGRLVAVAEAAPEIKEEVYQYLQALRGAPSPAAPAVAAPVPVQ